MPGCEVRGRMPLIDPLPPVEPSSVQRQVSETSSRSVRPPQTGLNLSPLRQ
jgi:hypothetical protein